MSGIIGSFAGNYEWVRKNIDDLKRRGPDGWKIIESDAAVFGYTNLRIDAEKMHPILSNNVLLCFDGRIWNKDKIRSKIKNFNWMSWDETSDADLVFLYYVSFCRNNPIKLLRDLIGMFALAIYDRRTKNKILMRDEMGQRPLYYTLEGEFASKQKILSKNNMLDMERFKELMFYGYPKGSLYHDVYEVIPGTMVLNNKVHYLLKDYSKNNIFINYEYFKNLFEESVKNNFFNRKVPIAFAFSGGLDTCAILSTLIKNDLRDIKLVMLDIGNEEDNLNSRKIAEEFGFEYSVFKKNLCSGYTLLNRLETPIELGSVFFIENIAREVAEYTNCKTVLLGDGGDELLLGYDRYKEENKNYLQRITKNNFYNPIDLEWDLEKIRRYDIKNELIYYHVKSKDIYSEFGLEARCPFLYQPIRDLVLRTNSYDLLDKKWIRKIIKEHGILNKIYYLQSKRAFKIGNVDKIRNSLIMNFLEINKK